MKFDIKFLLIYNYFYKLFNFFLNNKFFNLLKLLNIFKIENKIIEFKNFLQ
jgi:hypothetical protein